MCRARAVRALRHSCGASAQARRQHGHHEHGGGAAARAARGRHRTGSGTRPVRDRTRIRGVGPVGHAPAAGSRAGRGRSPPRGNPAGARCHASARRVQPTAAWRAAGPAAMRCPKCSYIGFEEADRCRNCGYEFALSDAQPAAADLPMRIGEDDGGPLVDLTLTQRAGGRPERPPTPATVKPRLDLDRMIGIESPNPDLPLFDEAADLGQDLPPLVSAPASPRRPLAVRRHPPLPAPVRRPPPDIRPPAGGTLDLPLPRNASADRISRAGALEPGGMVLAGSVRRVMAALLDTLLLGGVHWVTIYFTLRLCGLTLAEWRVLSLVPLLVFFLLVDGAYLTAFTTAG